jgi:glyoxylase-like metal-dependent hydrolase (beta-lactamase superfamily II)
MYITPYQYSKDDQKVTTYKLNFNNHNIMLDCGSTYLTKSDFIDVDYIFISHAHLDHWIGLFDNYIHIKEDCKIYTTNTTRKLIIQMVTDILNGDSNKTAQEKRQIARLFSNIIGVYFEEEIKIDNLTFTIYPAGHMYGACMIYLSSNKGNFLYTGDMDYVKTNNVRSYVFDNKNKVDYLLIDGTKLHNSTFKKEWISQIAKEIENKAVPEYRIKINDKSKAVYIAFDLALDKRLDDYRIIYDDDLLKVNTILHEQGYAVYLDNKILPKSYDNKFRKKIIISSTDYKDKWRFSEFKLGLHISGYDLNEFIIDYCKDAKVLIGHYDTEHHYELVKQYPQYTFLVNKVKVNL